MNLQMIDALCDVLGCACSADEPMSRHTTFHIGGPCDRFVTAESVTQLQALLPLCKEQGIPVFFLGNGSNLLVSDKGIRGVVLALGKNFQKISLYGETDILCGAGVNLSALCRFALEHDLTGLEFAYGIPGQVGGAVCMNAGAYGGQLQDVLISTQYVDFDGLAGAYTAENMQMGYRQCVYQSGKEIVCSARFRLQKGNEEEIRAKMDDLLARRKEKQPLEYPSAGSVFKRPVGYFAGALIEQCGLKGTRIGGAMVSEKHAGFIVNVGGATCADVCKLIAHIQKTVRENTGVMLECEVRVTGEAD